MADAEGPVWLPNKIPDEGPNENPNEIPNQVPNQNPPPNQNPLPPLNPFASDAPLMLIVLQRLQLNWSHFKSE